MGTPKSELRHFEETLLEEENWTAVQAGIEARLVGHPDGKGGEKFVLCRSTARAQKERAGVRTELRLRVVAKPEADAAQLLATSVFKSHANPKSSKM